jgi:hypothetical protein
VGRTDLEGAALDLEGMTLGQSLSYPAAALGQDALEGGAGDIHAPGCLLLGQTFEIGQAQGLELLLQEADAAQSLQRYAGRLVDRSLGRAVEETPLPGPGH